jgi:hypothetical protein
MKHRKAMPPSIASVPWDHAERGAWRRYVDFDCRVQLCHVFIIHIGLRNIDEMTDYVTVWLIGRRPRGLVT